MRTLRLALVGLSLLAWGRTAFAEDISPPAGRDEPSLAPEWGFRKLDWGDRTPRPKFREVWYGWQTLVVDVGAGMFIAGAVIAKNEVPAFLGSTAYVLGGPIVHIAHRHPVTGAGSLVLRLGAPLIGGVVGAGIEGCSPGATEKPDDSSFSEGEGGFCGARGLAAGLIVGALTAIVVDVGVLSHEEVPVKHGLVVLPKLHISENRAEAGLIGEF